MIKESAPDDPMELTGVKLDGDLGLMIDSIVEEYAGIGWDESQILQIFNRPFFRSTYNAARAVPPEQLRKRVRDVLGRCGVVKVAIHRSEESDHPNPLPDSDLVQVQPSASATPGDSR